MTESPSLPRLREEAASCTRCPLYRDATQTVFGEGPARARLMLVGEQPGDREDVEGAPFVGPAGRLLDQALDEARIPRRDVYITYIVKHFKFTRQGKRRIHQKPDAEEIAACRVWFDSELEAVRPALVVALGATPAKALLGSSFKISKERALLYVRNGTWYSATAHPDSVLNSPDEERRRINREDLFEDFRHFARALEQVTAA